MLEERNHELEQFNSEAGKTGQGTHGPARADQQSADDLPERAGGI